MKVFGYCRVSTAMQVEGFSLEVQEAAIRRLYPEAIILREEGVTGSKPFHNRPAGQKFFKSVENGDIIVTVKLDRMFRNTQDTLDTVERLRKRNIGVVALDMGTEPVGSPGVGKLILTVLAAVAEMERARFMERSAEGVAAKQSAGGFAGGSVPWGWSKIGQRKEAWLEPNLDEREAAEAAALMQEAGFTLGEICHALFKQKRYARNGKRLWRRPQITAMIAARAAGFPRYRSDRMEK